MQLFLEHWALPNGSTSLDPQLQNKNKCIHQEHTFSVYIHECSTLGKPYGIKLRCYWELLREQLGNLKETWWEHIKNKEGKKRKKEKVPPPHPQKEKQGPSWMHAEPSHWLHEISISKTIYHHFWTGLRAGAEIWWDSSLAQGREIERELGGRVDDNNPLNLFREVKTAEVGAP